MVYSAKPFSSVLSGEVGATAGSVCAIVATSSSGDVLNTTFSSVLVVTVLKRQLLSAEGSMLPVLLLAASLIM